MKKFKKRVDKVDIYLFLTDKENKSLIVTFLAFLLMIIIFSLVQAFWLKLVLYYIAYVLVVKKYDKFVDKLFNGKCYKFIDKFFKGV